MRIKSFIFVLLSFLIISCEKPIIPSENESTSKGNVILHFSPYLQSNFTRSTANVAYTKVNVMLFNKGTSTRAFDKIKTQSIDDEGFGTMVISVPAGQYDILAVGHSSHKSATLAKDKVSFTAYEGKKITDTFWCLDTITATEEPKTFDLEQNRAVAMFRLVITDSIPDNIATMKFEYSGGSADFNPATGNGVTNSKQSELREVGESNTFEVYTFPKDNKKLSITVTALDAEDNILVTKQFTDVPVKVRTITSYTGNFFDGGTSVISGNSFTFTVNDKWEETNSYTF